MISTKSSNFCEPVSDRIKSNPDSMSTCVTTRDCNSYWSEFDLEFAIWMACQSTNPITAKTRLRFLFELIVVENIATIEEATITNKIFLILEDSFEMSKMSRTIKEKIDFGLDKITQKTKLKNGTAS